MPRVMTIEQLSVLIAGLPGDMVVLVPGGDHEYFNASIGVENVWKNSGRPRPGIASYQESSLEGEHNAQALVISVGLLI